MVAGSGGGDVTPHICQLAGPWTGIVPAEPCLPSSPAPSSLATPHLESNSFTGFREINVHTEGVVHWGHTALVYHLLDKAGEHHEEGELKGMKRRGEGKIRRWLGRGRGREGGTKFTSSLSFWQGTDLSWCGGTLFCRGYRASGLHSTLTPPAR